MRKGAAFLILVVVAIGLAVILVLGSEAPRNVVPLHRARLAARTPPVPTEAPRPPTLAPAATQGKDPETAPPPDAACPAGMILVRGEHCTFVAHKCVGNKAPVVCERFVDEVLCEGSLFAKRYCVDQYEYPNEKGVRPAMFVTYDDARSACEAEQKRLCTVAEWQLACEGSARTPYVNGLVRDETCNTDRPDPDGELLDDPFEVTLELDRLDGRVPSGTTRGCDSAFGVADMGGNLAEWVENLDGGSKAPPFHFARAGGGFGAAPSTCRTLVTDVPASRRSHRVGFRCCSDAAQSGEATSLRLKKKPPSGFQKIGRRDAVPSP